MEECLAYFRRAVSAPLTVPPWSEWWAVNSELVERAFARLDYVRLKHRRLRGAREILQNIGELSDEFRPPSPSTSGGCHECGERTTIIRAGPGGGMIECPICGIICLYDTVDRISSFSDGE